MRMASSDSSELVGKVMLCTRALTASDAEAIGRLVLERQWRQAAADMVERYKAGRHDLKPALRMCYDIVGFWNRLTLGLTPVSESEKWQALESVASGLYPRGPDDHGLWERAGGDDADLPSTGPGRTRWRQGIRYMRQGKSPAPRALLAVMMEDYPHNERLVHLAKDAVFQGTAERAGGKGHEWQNVLEAGNDKERFHGRTRRCHWNREL